MPLPAWRCPGGAWRSSGSRSPQTTASRGRMTGRGSRVRQPPARASMPHTQIQIQQNPAESGTGRAPANPPVLLRRAPRCSGCGPGARCRAECSTGRRSPQPEARGGQGGCETGVGRGAARNTRRQRGGSSPCSWLRLVRARGRPTHHGSDHGHDLGEGCHLQGTGQAAPERRREGVRAPAWPEEAASVAMGRCGACETRDLCACSSRCAKRCPARSRDVPNARRL